MAFLVRRVPDSWKQKILDDEIGPEMSDIPAWALGLFSPGDLEVDEISLYIIQQEADLVHLAAAWFASMQQTVGSTWAALSVETANKYDLQWEVDGLGSTSDSIVNSWHVSLKIKTGADLERVVRSFSSGEIMSCEKKATEKALEVAVRTDRLTLTAPAKNKSDANPYRKVPGWLADGWLTVSGLPA